MRLILGTFLRIARYGVETPAKCAAFQVIRGQIAAGAVEIGTGTAHDDEVAGDYRRGRQRVGCLWAAGRQRIDFPQPLAGRRVERVQIAVERTDVDAAVPDGNTAVNGVAAGVTAPLAVDLRIVGPQFAAGGGIEH